MASDIPLPFHRGLHIEKVQLKILGRRGLNTDEIFLCITGIDQNIKILQSL